MQRDFDDHVVSQLNKGDVAIVFFQEWTKTSQSAFDFFNHR